MIIDSHLHLIRKRNIDEKIYNKFNFSLPIDTNIEQLIKWLKEAGVLKAVIMGQDMQRLWNTSFGEDYIFEVFKNFPDFFIPLASIEPIDKFNRFNSEAFKYFVKAIDENGFRGLLLTPPYGQFMSNDKALYPFYNFAQERGVIVQFHHSAQTGPAVFAPTKYTQMVNLNDVIIDFPNLKVVVEHLGYPCCENLFVLMVNDKNIYTDLAMTYERPMWLTWNLVIAKEYGVIDRVMYASDFIAVNHDLFSSNPTEDFKKWIKFIKSEMNSICNKCKWPKFTREEIEGILFNNACNLYNIRI